MNYIKITIQANMEQQDILISFLSDLDVMGFEQSDTYLTAYFDEQNFRSFEITKTIKGYDFQISTITAKNWNDEWEADFNPVVIDDFCAIRAQFHKPITKTQYDIIITPKMSFGTGHHATTFMMIAQMKDLDFINKVLLDFGTGTGVLAILAEKLGASNITAIDIDDWSIENATENAVVNNCSKINFKLSSIIPDKKFDIILANIIRNTIMDYLPELKKALNENGFLLLSGLLVNDEKDIIQLCINHNIQLVRRLEKNQWISLLCINKQ
jgi:ribosomal protein L11 methyltransferase